MEEVLIIDGSPRRGNTQFVCEFLKSKLEGGVCKIIKIAHQKILPCTGCLSCSKAGNCRIDDDMNGIRAQITDARCLVFGAPNYFDGIPGPAKTLIDRLNPFFGKEVVKNKPFMSFMVGGMADQSQCLGSGFGGMVRHLGLNDIGSYYLQGLNPGDLRGRIDGIHETLDDMVSRIRKVLI